MPANRVIGCSAGDVRVEQAVGVGGGGGALLRRFVFRGVRLKILFTRYIRVVALVRKK